MSAHKFSNIAKGMAPGTFAILNNGSDASGYNITFTASGSTATFNSFTWKNVYDPLWHRVLIIGDGGHIEGVDTTKFACYELDYDRWTLLPYTPYTILGNMHIYGLLAHVSKPGGPNWLWRIGGNDNLAHRWNTDFANPNAIAYLGSSYPPPFASGPSNSRGSIEYFPERDEMLFHFSTTGELLRKPLTTGSWAVFDSHAELSGDGVGLAYNPVSKVVVYGGGGASDNPKWWRYDAAGVVTPLDNFNAGYGARPTLQYFSEWSLIAADPSSGKFFIVRRDVDDLTKVSMWELNPLAASGTQWVRLAPTIEAAWPANITDTATSNIGCVTIPEYNVILFTAYNKTWLYKHGPGLTFAQKASVKGVLSSHPFSSQSELKNTWPGGQPYYAPLEAYLRTLGSGIGYDFPWPFSTNRLPGEGNNACTVQPVSNAMGVPIIDGTNGLRFQIPSRSVEGNGNYNANFDDVLYSDPNAAVAINPTSPYGRVFYMQMKVKADAAYWAAQFRKHDDFTVNNDLYGYPGLYGVACLAGSRILAVPASAGYSVFTNAYVGKEMLLMPGSPAWVPAFYFITQFIDAQHVQLDRSPCPTADGYGAFMNIEGTIDHGFGVPLLLPGGPKLCILTGNPPNYGLPSYVAKLKQNQSEVYFKGPQMVQGATGAEPINANLNRSLLWDQTTYNEFTVRIEVGQVQPATAGWRITWWLNGLKDDPQTDWYDGAGWSGPTGFWSASPSVGFGWLQIVMQMTHKDPTQYHADATVWVKDVIVSTQPIQMNSAVSVAATYPVAPCAPWFLRS